MSNFWKWFNLLFYVWNLVLFLVAFFKGEVPEMILHGVVLIVLGQILTGERILNEV